MISSDVVRQFDVVIGNNSRYRLYQTSQDQPEYFLTQRANQQLTKLSEHLRISLVILELHMRDSVVSNLKAN